MGQGRSVQALQLRLRRAKQRPELHSGAVRSPAGCSSQPPARGRQVHNERYIGSIGVNFGECAPCQPYARKLEPPVACLRGCLPFLNPR
jgi:hypothetical protein